MIMLLELGLTMCCLLLCNRPKVRSYVFIFVLGVDDAIFLDQLKCCLWLASLLLHQFLIFVLIGVKGHILQLSVLVDFQI